MKHKNISNRITWSLLAAFLVLGACSEKNVKKSKISDGVNVDGAVQDSELFIYDVAQTDFEGTTYVGDYILNPDAYGDLLGAHLDSDNPAKHLYTITMNLENLEGTSFQPYMVPELIYPIKNDSSKTSFGLRLIPVGGEGGRSIETPDGENNDRGVNMRAEPFNRGPVLNQEEWWRAIDQLENIEREAFRNDPANDYEGQLAAHRTENFEEFATDYREDNYEWELEMAQESAEENGEEFDLAAFETAFSARIEVSFTRNFEWRFMEGFNDTFWDYWDEYANTHEVEIDDDNVPATKVIDALLRKSFYGEAEKENLEKPIYSIMGHTGDYQTIFTDLGDLVDQKSETGYHHVSTYYGNNGVSRRPLLHGGHPDNVFTVSMKGTDQEAFNLNAQIWAKLYYQNPEGYQFSSNYSWDYFVNSNLEEVLAFAKGWVKEDWIRRDLNQKIIDNAADLGIDGKDAASIGNKTYYEFLQEDPAAGLYCFEGVTNMLNVAINVPLTIDYLKRIFGESHGQEIFDLANARYRQVLSSEGVAEEDLAANDLKSEKVTSSLAPISALWEKSGVLQNPEQYTKSNPLYPERNKDGSIDARVHPEVVSNDDVRKEDYKKIGNSLAWAPQTTADIIKDLIHIYVPFHRASAANSAGVVLKFQEEHERRTGISATTYNQFAVQIMTSMFKWESSKIKTQLAGAVQSGQMTQAQADGALAQYKAKQEEVFTAQFGIPDVFGAMVGPAIDAAGLLNPSELAADTDFGTLAWNKFLLEAKLILREANKTPVHEPNVIRQRLAGDKAVKYYSRPGVLASMALGVWPTNPHIKLTPIATVVGPNYVAPAPAGAEPDHQINNMSSDISTWTTVPVTAKELQDYQETLYAPIGHHE